MCLNFIDSHILIFSFKGCGSKYKFFDTLVPEKLLYSDVNRSIMITDNMTVSIPPIKVLYLI